MLNFNKIPSIDSKFDTLNNFYKDFKKLEGVKSQTKERKLTVLEKNCKENNYIKKCINAL